jgi:hypothetical protein
MRSSVMLSDINSNFIFKILPTRILNLCNSYHFKKYAKYKKRINQFNLVEKISPLWMISKWNSYLKKKADKHLARTNSIAKIFNMREEKKDEVFRYKATNYFIEYARQQGVYIKKAMGPAVKFRGMIYEMQSHRTSIYLSEISFREFKPHFKELLEAVHNTKLDAGILMYQIFTTICTHHITGKPFYPICFRCAFTKPQLITDVAQNFEDEDQVI